NISMVQEMLPHAVLMFITPPSPVQANIQINNNLQRQSSFTSQPLTDQQGIKNCICQDLQNCSCRVCKSILSNHRNQNINKEPKNENIATRNENMN
ncbi:5176_t:CDS:2, partial [Gigaspora margarita]